MQPANPNRSGCSIKAFNAERPPMLAPMIPKFLLFNETSNFSSTNGITSSVRNSK